MRILLLEDDIDRERRMLDCVAGRFPDVAVVAFRSATRMNEWLRADDLGDVALISLDHDLEPTEEGHDPGCGRDVADQLAARRPVCPVILHTTNARAAVGMERVLTDSGWDTRRVIPEPDPSWIADYWFRAMRNAIVDSVPLAADTPSEV